MVCLPSKLLPLYRILGLASRMATKSSPETQISVPVIGSKVRVTTEPALPPPKPAAPSSPSDSFVALT
jgi:hypothetical protein